MWRKWNSSAKLIEADSYVNALEQLGLKDICKSQDPGIPLPGTNLRQNAAYLWFSINTVQPSLQGQWNEETDSHSVTELQLICQHV